MKAAAETTLSIAADEKRLGAKIGTTAVLHTWGSAMTHHPHVHMIVPGGGLAPDGSRWISARSNFLVHVNVLARLFRAKMLAMLMDAHEVGRLRFFNTHAGLADRAAFKRLLGPLRHVKWVVYFKAPFAGPEAVLRYLSRLYEAPEVKRRGGRKHHFPSFTALHALSTHFLVRPRRSFPHPGHTFRSPTRTGAVKIGRRCGHPRAPTFPGRILTASSRAARWTCRGERA